MGNEKDKAPGRVWINSLPESGRVTAYVSPIREVGSGKSLSLAEYIRADLLATVNKKDTEIAQGIVREWSEHDMNEHYNSDYLRDEFGSEHLEQRIANSLATVRAEALDAACLAICARCRLSEQFTPAERIGDGRRWFHRAANTSFEDGIASQCDAWPIRNLTENRKGEG